MPACYRTRQSRVLLALLTAAFLCLAGCGERLPPPSVNPPPPPGTPGAPAPQRIVAFAPSLAEFIFALKAEERLVGVSQYCVDPPAVKKIPVLGNAVDPDLEKILAAKPDLIMTVGEGAKLKELGAAHQIRVESWRIETLEEVLAAPARIGEIIGAQDRAKRLSAKMRFDLDAVAKICKDRKSTPRVLVMTGDGGSRFTIGRGSFLTDLVTLCGGESVTADLAKPWPEIGLEDLAKCRPDVIVMLQARDELSDADRQKLIDSWNDHPDFPAVKNHRIEILVGNYLLLGGPRITLTALNLAQALHPELGLVKPLPAQPSAPPSTPAPAQPAAEE